MRKATARLMLYGAMALGLPAFAQDAAIPKMIRIVVPFSAGASNDVIARAIAPQLAKRLDTTVIVENRPGAG
ncbi:MAG TPA: tripartite tricarboxylate transporter substrate binding protein, partial [Burkholderiales bacterium]|nr:tripartite tricarboxylate transporter substrate binding protein [Burkholderiales bacterium]